MNVTPIAAGIRNSSPHGSINNIVMGVAQIGIHANSAIGNVMDKIVMDVGILLDPHELGDVHPADAVGKIVMVNIVIKTPLLNVDTLGWIGLGGRVGSPGSGSHNAIIVDFRIFANQTNHSPAAIQHFHIMNFGAPRLSDAY